MGELLEAAGLLYSGPAYTRRADGDLRVSDRYRDAAQLVSSTMLDIIGWKTVKPTEPGWYWWREEPDDRRKDWKILRCRLEMEFTIRGEEKCEEWLIAAPFGDYQRVTDMGGEWAGPIPFPTDQPGEA